MWVKKWAIIAIACVLIGLLPSCRSYIRLNPRSEQLEVYIPPGEFTAGQHPNNTPGSISAQATMRISLPGYWISQTQVTNAQYRKCEISGGCGYSIGPDVNPYYYLAEYANHPVVFVSWYEAQEFCLWAGGRLPHELEWEKAARGNLANSFPWGETDDFSNRAQVGHYTGADTTAAVGSFASGSSPYGVMDMGGNVREWIDDWFDEENVVLRGAAWYDPPVYSLTYARLSHEPSSRGQGRGFRCVFEYSIPLIWGQ